MTYEEYKRNFDRRRSAFMLESLSQQYGFGCKTNARPAMPPWLMDWAVIFADGMYFRIKETYTPDKHPRYALGVRLHFCYQYGKFTELRKGMPFSASSGDTVIRLDQDQHGVHMHYKGQNHISQSELSGNLELADAEAFTFVEAVQQHRDSRSENSFEDILQFKVKPKGTQ